MRTICTVSLYLAGKGGQARQFGHWYDKNGIASFYQYFPAVTILLHPRDLGCGGESVSDRERLSGVGRHYWPRSGAALSLETNQKPFQLRAVTLSGPKIYPDVTKLGTHENSPQTKSHSFGHLLCTPTRSTANEAN